MSNGTNYTPDTDAEVLNKFWRNCSFVAGMQGRLAYLIMSVHYVHPEFLERCVSRSITKILYVNMVYGLTVLIYARPNMRPIGFFNRAAFSLLGSLMFCHSSVSIFNYFATTFSETMPCWASFLSFLCGRICMVHLLAFLYHVDVRSTKNYPRDSAFDAMYLNNATNNNSSSS